MSDLAIKIENISKAYRIGLKEQKHDTLGATLVSWAKSPFKNFKNLKSLSNFNNGEEDDVFWAVKDINFEVKKGEVLGIIGKNGAGKSTLLKILSRITEPTEGRIEIYGRVASLLEVGTGFNPELSGRENVYLNGTILGMTKKEIDLKFDEIIDFSGIEKFIDTPVKRYSSGMKVRLAFAVAAHLDPEILIIDEVLAVGDAEFQKKCLGKIQDVSKYEGRTVLFVSHDLVAVQKLCTRCILLANGEIRMNDNPVDTINFYLSDDLNNTVESLQANFSNRRGFGKLKLHQLTIERKNYNIGEDIKVEFEISASENVNDCLLYIAIKNIQGIEVFYATNRYSGTFSNLTKGITKGSFTISPNYLMPDIYSLRFTINQGGTTSDWVEDIVKFDINPINENKELIPDYKVGFYYHPIKWQNDD